MGAVIRRYLHKALAILLCICLLITYTPAPAKADETHADAGATSIYDELENTGETSATYDATSNSWSASTDVKIMAYGSIQVLPLLKTIVFDEGTEKGSTITMFVTGGNPWKETVSGKTSYKYELTNVTRSPDKEENAWGFDASKAKYISPVSDAEDVSLLETNGLDPDKTCKITYPIKGYKYQDDYAYTIVATIKDSANTTKDVEFTVLTGGYSKTSLTYPESAKEDMIAKADGTFLKGAILTSSPVNAETNPLLYNSWAVEYLKSAKDGFKEDSLGIQELTISNTRPGDAPASKGVDTITLAVKSDELINAKAEAESKDVTIKVVGISSDGTPFTCDVTESYVAAVTGKSPATVSFTPPNNGVGAYGVVYLIEDSDTPTPPEPKTFTVKSTFELDTTEGASLGSLSEANPKCNLGTENEDGSYTYEVSSDLTPTLTYTVEDGYIVSDIQVTKKDTSAADMQWVPETFIPGGNSVYFENGFTSDVDITVKVKKVSAPPVDPDDPDDPKDYYTVSAQAKNGAVSFSYDADGNTWDGNWAHPADETHAASTDGKNFTVELNLNAAEGYKVPDFAWIVPKVEADKLGDLSKVPDTERTSWAKHNFLNNDNVQSITVDADVVLYVEFAEDTGVTPTEYTVTVPARKSDTHGTISYGDKNNEDAAFEFSAKGVVSGIGFMSDEGYVLDSITVTPADGKPYDATGDNAGKASGQFSIGSITGPVSVSATFKKKSFPITVTKAGSGEVSAPESVDFGETARATVTPDTGCVLLYVEETWTDEVGTEQRRVHSPGEKVDGAYTIEFGPVEAPVKLNAVFTEQAITPPATAENSYALVFADEGHTSWVSPSSKDESDAIEFAKGGKLTLNFTPSPVDRWSVSRVVVTTGEGHTFDTSVKTGDASWKDTFQNPIGKASWVFDSSKFVTSGTSSSASSVFYINVEFAESGTSIPGGGIAGGTDTEGHTPSLIDVASTGVGTISPAGSVNAYQGVSQTFKITPGSDRQVASILIKDADGITRDLLTQASAIKCASYDASTGTLTFTPGCANPQIMVQFKSSHVSTDNVKLVVGVEGRGSVSPVSVEVPPGTIQDISFTPDEGYYLASVTVKSETDETATEFKDMVSSIQTLSLAVTSNTTVKATFKPITAGDPDSPSADEQEKLEKIGHISFNPKSGTGGSISPSSKGDATINFTPKDYSASLGEGAPVNARLTFSVKPDLGYEFVRLTLKRGDTSLRIYEYTDSEVLKASSGVCSVSIPSDFVATFGLRDGDAVDVLAEFKEKDAEEFDISVTWNSETSGASYVSPAKNSGDVVKIKRGGKQTFSFICDSNIDEGWYYKVSKVSVDGIERDIEGNSITLFNVVDPHSIHVVFERVSGPSDGGATAAKKTITVVQPEAGGSIRPAGASGKVEVAANENITFEFVPDEGYALLKAVVDGVDIPASHLTHSSYTFADVVSDHTISAVFYSTADTPSLSVFTTYNVSLTPEVRGITSESQVFVYDPATDGTGTSASGKNVKISATYGWRIKSITALGTTSSSALARLNNSLAANVNGKGLSSYEVKLPFIDGGTYTLSAVFEEVPMQPGGDDENQKQETSVYVGVAKASDGALHGSVSPFGVTSFYVGEDFTMSLFPDAGYVPESIIVDGINRISDMKTTDSGYTFTTKVVDGMNIEVTFRPRTTGDAEVDTKSVLLLTSSLGYGHITPAGITRVVHGSSVSLTTIPDSGYELKNLTVGGVDVTDKVKSGVYTLKVDDELLKLTTSAGFICAVATFVNKTTGQLEYEMPYVDVVVDVDVSVGTGSDGESKNADKCTVLPPQQTVKPLVEGEKDAHFTAYVQDGWVLSKVRAKTFDASGNMLSESVVYERGASGRASSGRTADTKGAFAVFDTTDTSRDSWVYEDYPEFTVKNPTTHTVLYPSCEPASVRYHGYFTGTITSSGGGYVNPTGFVTWQANRVCPVSTFKVHADKGQRLERLVVNEFVYTQEKLDAIREGKADPYLKYSASTGDFTLTRTFEEDFSIHASFTGQAIARETYEVELGSDSHGYMGDATGKNLEAGVYGVLTLTPSKPGSAVELSVYAYPDSGYTLKGVDVEGGVKLVSTSLVSDAKASSKTSEYSAYENDSEAYLVNLEVTDSGSAYARHIKLGAMQPKDYMTITPSAGSHGRISPSTPQVVEKGDNTVEFKLIPDAGYSVSELVVNGTHMNYTGTTYTLRDVSVDTTVHVEFAVAAVPGDNSTPAKTIRYLRSLAQTGDLAAPGICLLLAVACGALGVAVLVSGRNQRRKTQDKD